ncbi:unnamed protein product [Echinostoma caproni]|uniref:NR LBD domain-containing protein n=1 Tax=Echinostoma caproni TaxID=27848 RepID=A0A183AVA4_9TREM|nr:unnamed protein product [Echinostoma caproni]
MLLHAESLSQRHSNITFAAFKRIGSRWIPPSNKMGATQSPGLLTTNHAAATATTTTGTGTNFSTFPTTISPSTSSSVSSSVTNDKLSDSHPDITASNELRRTRLPSDWESEFVDKSGDLDNDLPFRTLLTTVEWARNIPLFTELQVTYSVI